LGQPWLITFGLFIQLIAGLGWVIELTKRHGYFAFFFISSSAASASSARLVSAASASA